MSSDDKPKPPPAPPPPPRPFGTEVIEKGGRDAGTVRK